MSRGKALLSVLALGLLGAPVPLSAATSSEEDLAPKLRAALVKVHITNQGWDTYSPWNKSRPRDRTQRGVVVRPGLVLTPASGMVDQLMIEVSEANSGRRYPASLEHVDSSAGLALVKIDDEGLLARTAPLPLGEPITIDSEFAVWQLGDSDLVERSTGRVQQVYPRDTQLHLTVKTNLSDTGNGQVALADGRIVGLVIGTRSSRQEGTLLSVETIHHYLTDFDSGDYKGFGGPGIWSHDLLRDDLRAFYGVPDDAHGIAVSHVVPGRTGSGALEAGDVIVSLAGHDLDDEGMFVHPLHGRLHLAYLLHGATRPGDAVPAKILRGGEPMEVAIPIRNWPRPEQLIPANSNDRRPPYMVVGGLVLLELTRQSRVSSARLTQAQARAWWDPPGERKRIIYASRVLADPANKGIDEIGGVGVETVNGRKITEMKDLRTALEHPLDGYHVIVFDEIEKPFVVAAADLSAINQRIASRYRIPELEYLPEE